MRLCRTEEYNCHLSLSHCWKTSPLPQVSVLRLCFVLSLPLSTMPDSIHSEKTTVEQSEKLRVKSYKEAVSISPSINDAEETSAIQNVLDLEAYPDGGRAWLVVLGCFIFSAVTVGWGYVAIINLKLISND